MEHETESKQDTVPQDHHATPQDAAGNAQSSLNNNRWNASKTDVKDASGEASDNAPQNSHGPVSAETPEVFTGLHIKKPKNSAAGLPAVYRATQYVWSHAGVLRGSHALKLLNQKGGIDCMSCAWPEPDGDRAFAEFCENGAKAIGHELDKARCTPDFFARHSVAELSQQSDYWLEQQGRLTHPMVLRQGATHYAPIAWDDAFKLIADELNQLASPDQAAFYTSGRASNEAAFCYQLFVRQFGTNNLPDCSNMCHESSGSALSATLGVGKGTVTLDDFQKTQAIFIIGQNPGTNHPRMLTTLQHGKANGATIVVVNPLREAGLMGFMNPQEPLGLLGKSHPLADLFLPVRINGDIAIFKGIMKMMLEAEERERGSGFDWTFIQEKTHGIDALLENIRSTNWEDILRDSGVSRDLIERAAQVAIQSDRIICCWAMGLTQQNNAVETIQEIINFLLLRGCVGKPGAGACPVRGHSNVQGDRTMGVWERPRDQFLDALKRNFNFEPPRHHGYDAVETIKAVHEGKVKIFVQLGGNFLSATPDTLYVAEALAKLDLSVRIATKLNRTDLVAGKQALILPCLGRSEIDSRAGVDQFVTTENSMGIVQQSRGRFAPASTELRSETSIICELAQNTLGSRSNVPWKSWSDNYDNIRDAIARTIDGCEKYNEKVRHPGGFYLPNLARDNQYVTETGRANFTVNPIPRRDVKPDQLIMMTIRSHDQFNTTIYGLDDRYRGIHNERRVIFMNPNDMKSRNLSARDVVDLTSYFHEQRRHAKQFIVIPYEIPHGNCATYFPETNVLVPVGSTANRSNQPASKYVVITVTRSEAQKPEARVSNQIGR